MRAEMFSMLAGAKFGLPMPEHGSAERLRLWNQTFSSGESRALFRAASEAARALTTLRQFEAGEQPAARWFPKREAWPELVEMQKQRDAVTGVSFRENASGASRPASGSTTSRSLSESARAFEKTDDLTVKARLILQNPDFLNMALMLDPSATRELARWASPGQSYAPDVFPAWLPDILKTSSQRATCPFPRQSASWDAGA